MRVFTRVVPLALIGLGLALSACGAITGDAEIAQLETRSAQLQGTIDVLGTPALTMAALEAAATQNAVLQAQLSQAQNEALAAKATLTVLQLTGGDAAAVQPTALAQAVPLGDQPSGLPTDIPTPPGAQTSFTQTVTSTGRDDMDCATGVTSIFETAEDTIFVVTRVDFLPAGSTLGAQWMANGSLFFDDRQCWIPDQDYFDICAYCSIVPDGPTFEAGSWSVALLLDGQLMSQIPFQVVDSSAQPAVTGTPAASDGSGGMNQ